MPTTPPLPCLWMTAGLLTYRLCDRGYDCDGCPLDAALRGGGGETAAAARRSAGGEREAAWSAAVARAEEAEGGSEWPGRAGGPAGGERAGEPTTTGAAPGETGPEAAIRSGERGQAAAPGASLAGRPPAIASRSEPPDDRLYTLGHTWLQPRGDPEEGRFRFGLDGFAAALLEPPRAVRCAPAGRRLLAGETACELELDGGVLALALPVPAEVIADNTSCRRDPSLLLADPYGDGWLLDLGAGLAAELVSPADAATTGPGRVAHDAAPGPGLFPAAEARRRAGHDLRRFRRRVALDLLAADQGLGVTLPDGGEPLLDLRALLGPRRHLELVREIVG